MKLYINILSILLSVSNFVFSQNCTKTDTVKWLNYHIIIELPTDIHSHYNTYEEGFFKTISCFKDSTSIIIHCGAMVNLPLIDLTKNAVTSKFVLNKDVRILRGYCNSQNDGLKIKRYFREENYFKYGITIMYKNVDESRLHFYDSILNNVKIINIEKNP